MTARDVRLVAFGALTAATGIAVWQRGVDWQTLVVGLLVWVGALACRDWPPLTPDDRFAQRHRVDPRHPSQWKGER